jgi:hypothetical protein
LGRAAATSARPPVFEKGCASEAIIRIRRPEAFFGVELAGVGALLAGFGALLAGFSRGIPLAYRFAPASSPKSSTPQAHRYSAEMAV